MLQQNLFFWQRQAWDGMIWRSKTAWDERKMDSIFKVDYLVFSELFLKQWLCFPKIIAFSATTWEPWSQIIKYLSSWGQNQVTVLQKFIVIKMFFVLFFFKFVILLDPWFVNGQKRFFRWMRVALLKLFFLEPKYAL